MTNTTEQGTVEVRDDLIQMVYHIDARTTAVEGQLDELSGSMNRIEGHLLNKGNVNWVAVMGALAGIAFGLSNYIGQQINPLKERQDTIRSTVVGLSEFQHQAHYEIGVLTEQKEYYGLEIDRLWDHIHKLEDADKKHSDSIAAASTARRALGDYTKELGEQLREAR